MSPTDEKRGSGRLLAGDTRKYQESDQGRRPESGLKKPQKKAREKDCFTQKDRATQSLEQGQEEEGGGGRRLITIKRHGLVLYRGLTCVYTQKSRGECTANKTNEFKRKSFGKKSRKLAERRGLKRQTHLNWEGHEPFQAKFAEAGFAHWVATLKTIGREKNAKVSAREAGSKHARKLGLRETGPEKS